MSRPYSDDLRKRVAAVEAGLSRRLAAEVFDMDARRCAKSSNQPVPH